MDRPFSSDFLIACEQLLVNLIYDVNGLNVLVINKSLSVYIIYPLIGLVRELTHVPCFSHVTCVILRRTAYWYDS